jgi:coenzyme F420-reducing hydrogenase beta subunit
MQVLIEVTGHSRQVAIQKLADIIKGELGWEGSFTTTEQIVSMANDLLDKARDKGYFLAIKSP